MAQLNSVAGAGSIHWSAYLRLPLVARMASTRADRLSLAAAFERAGVLRSGVVSIAASEGPFHSWLRDRHGLAPVVRVAPRPKPQPKPQPRVPTAQIRHHWRTQLLQGHSPLDIPAEHLEALVLSDRRCARAVDAWFHSQRTRYGLRPTTTARLW